MNLKQLASELGLSQTTVSRALNGYPEVNEATRRRVAETAARLGYRPNASARPLATGRANTVRVGPQGFALNVTSPGEFLVRVSFTPYWSIGRGAGCLLRRGNWTIARTAHTGIFSVDADFSLGGAWNAMTGAKKTC